MKLILPLSARNVLFSQQGNLNSHFNRSESNDSEMNELPNKSIQIGNSEEVIRRVEHTPRPQLND